MMEKNLDEKILDEFFKIFQRIGKNKYIKIRSFKVHLMNSIKFNLIGLKCNLLHNKNIKC